MKKILFAISLLSLATLNTPAYAAIGLDGKLLNRPPACQSKTCPMHAPIIKKLKDLEDAIDHVNDLVQQLEENERARNQH